MKMSGLAVIESLVCTFIHSFIVCLPGQGCSKSRKMWVCGEMYHFISMEQTEETIKEFKIFKRLSWI